MTVLQVEPGAAVLVKATGEVGVVVRLVGNETVDVSPPGGVRLLHVDELKPADPDPDRLLLEGRLGDPTA